MFVISFSIAFFCICKKNWHADQSFQNHLAGKSISIYIYTFTSVSVLMRSSSTILEMCEERRFWNLLQDLIQNFCFVKIHYDVNFGGLAHEIILMLEVLCSNFFKVSMMNGSGTLTMLTVPQKLSPLCMFLILTLLLSSITSGLQHWMEFTWLDKFHFFMRYSFHFIIHS